MRATVVVPVLKQARGGPWRCRHRHHDPYAGKPPRGRRPGAGDRSLDVVESTIVTVSEPRPATLMGTGKIRDQGQP